MTQQPLRQERNVFLLFLGASFVALMAGLPLVTATTAGALAQGEKQSRVPPAQRSEHPSFEQADRNKDGFIDKSEAGVVQGLSANFERADRNKDGKLDQAEFAKGLEILAARR